MDDKCMVGHPQLWQEYIIFLHLRLIGGNLWILIVFTDQSRYNNGQKKLWSRCSLSQDFWQYL